MLALAAPASSVGVVTPPPDVDYQSVALPRPAADCYDLFCDLARIPEWLNVVRSTVVTSRKPDGRPHAVAFLARLERATVGYTCTYHFDDEARRVWWTTRADASIHVSGIAQFSPLGDKACLMTYGLVLDLGDGGLPAWADPQYAGHAASASMEDFRDFVLRAL